MLVLPAALAQPGSPLPVGAFGQPPPPAKTSEVRFDLDFPGGTPGELVKAIEKSAGKPLNAIIPVELAEEQLPALRMKSVIIRDLFQALERSSQKSVRYITGSSYSGFGGGTQFQYAQTTTTLGFQTQGPQEYESIWCFFKSMPPDANDPKICRFYNLAPYLETYKVEDITTAVEQGQKLLRENSASPLPWQKSKLVMNYHPDTKLLIVVGQQEQMKLLDSVLAELADPKSAARLIPGQPVGRPAQPVIK
jgi:hypothetical protein